MKKSILIVVTNYLDETLISSRRWRYIAEYLTEQQYLVTVISHDGGNETKEIQVNGVDVVSLRIVNSTIKTSGTTNSVWKYRKWITPLKIIYYFLKSQLEEKALKKFIKKELEEECLKKVCDKEYYAVISSVYNMDAFFIAKILRHHLKIKRHICDIRDPLINPFFGNQASQIIGIKNAKAIIKEAEVITTVAEDVKADLQSTGLARKKAIYVLPHAYKKRVKLESKPADLEDSGFSLSFVGTYYPSIYNMSPLVKAVQELVTDGIINEDCFEIIVAGKNSDGFVEPFKRAHLDQYIKNKGFVSYQEALQIQNKTDILLFVSKIEQVGAYVGAAGKFPEYLSFNKEILMIFNVRKNADKQLDYFENLSVGLCVNADSEESTGKIKKWIYDKIVEKKNGRILHEPNRVEVGKYSVEQVGRQVEMILESLK